MKASRSKASHKAFIIKQAQDRTPVAKVCPKADKSSQTFIAFEKQYEGFVPLELKRFREIQHENPPLNILV